MIKAWGLRGVTANATTRALESGQQPWVGGSVPGGENPAEDGETNF